MCSHPDRYRPISSGYEHQSPGIDRASTTAYAGDVPVCEGDPVAKIETIYVTASLRSASLRWPLVRASRGQSSRSVTLLHSGVCLPAGSALTSAGDDVPGGGQNAQGSTTRAALLGGTPIR
jgi:hypothetical protein